MPEDDHAAPPSDLTAESSVLGAVLKRPAAIGTVCELAAADFYAPAHRAIWRAMLDLWARNVPIDYTTLDHRLSAPDLAPAQVTLAQLAQINLAVPTAAHIEHYAKIVADCATQRRYLSAFQSATSDAWRSGVDLDVLAQRIDGYLAAARPRTSRRELYDPERWAAAFLDDLEARQAGQRTAVTTGLIDLDAMTLGLEAGGLYLLMGTPGTGKTELAMQVGMHVANTHGPVLFASLEMSAVELAHRYARISRGLDRNRLAKGQLDDDDAATVLEVITTMRTGRFWPAAPSARYTTADLRADALEVRTTAGNVALIVADYVQRFDDGDNVPGHREINVGMVAKSLKSLAREFGCPVLAPVQPNREYASRLNKRPLLSDLRESGKLEQEADVVLGLFRDEKHNDATQDRGIAELHMLKNRSGVGNPEGMRRLRWAGACYENLSAKREPAFDDGWEGAA